MTRLAAALTLLAALADARQAPPGPRRAGQRLAVFTATEYAFQGPAALPAGRTTLRLVNRGRLVHQGQLVRVLGGHSAQEARQALAAGQGAEWLMPAGGFGAIAPGETGRVTLQLFPGPYVLYCALSTGDGRVHADLGMVFTFTADDAAGAVAESASVLAVLTVSDFGFRFQRTFRVRGRQLPIEARLLGTPLPPGEAAFEIENLGPSPHEIQILRTDSTETVRGFADWLSGGQRGRSPGRPLGGTAALAPGMKVRLQLTLTPGTYWLYCPVRHRRTSRGFEVGEVSEFIVTR